MLTNEVIVTVNCFLTLEQPCFTHNVSVCLCTHTLFTLNVTGG